MAPPVWVPGQVLNASDINSWFVPIAAIKTSDQSVTSSTTVVNDTALVVAMPATGTYFFECFVEYDGGTGGSSDIKFNWAVPTSATLRYTMTTRNLSNNPVAGDATTGSTTNTASSGGAGVLRAIGMVGSLVMAGTAGNLQFQWAQNTSSATSTIVHAQSMMLLYRMT